MRDPHRLWYRPIVSIPQGDHNMARCISAYLKVGIMHEQILSKFGCRDAFDGFGGFIPLHLDLILNQISRKDNVEK